MTDSMKPWQAELKRLRAVETAQKRWHGLVAIRGLCMRWGVTHPHEVVMMPKEAPTDPGMRNLDRLVDLSALTAAMDHPLDERGTYIRCDIPDTVVAECPSIDGRMGHFLFQRTRREFYPRAADGTIRVEINEEWIARLRDEQVPDPWYRVTREELGAAIDVVGARILESQP